LAGQDKTDKLVRYGEQIIVLRGGALNGIILLSLCAFGLCAERRKELRGIWKAATFLPALSFLLAGVLLVIFSIRADYAEHSYSDPPLAEAVLTSLGLTGLVVRPANGHSRLYLRGMSAGFVFTLILYGAWWWTEVLYDQSVIHFFDVIPAGAAS
jgi:hypothetical protein